MNFSVVALCSALFPAVMHSTDGSSSKKIIDRNGFRHKYSFISSNMLSGGQISENRIITGIFKIGIELFLGTQKHSVNIIA